MTDRSSRTEASSTLAPSRTQHLDVPSGLRAVEEFSRAHDSGAIARSGFWRSLLPARGPGPGEQYAFEVRLDACSGCKSCVTACHSLNDLADDEVWREVGLLWIDRDGAAVPQHVTASCHHCVEPGCLAGCPVRAYEKDAVTGIVQHLDDRCFGCRYCTLTCPYEVPRFRPEQGIVRKCDLCSERLSAGEAPACVAACPSRAISIRTVATSELRARAEQSEFVPELADPSWTVPSTIYSGGEELERVSSVAASLPERPHSPREAHPSLSSMLVATQASIGLLLIGPLLVPDSLAQSISRLALVLLALGLFASVLHLGRPQLAWRAWMGWRTSWLSREVIAFALFFTALSVEVSLSAIVGPQRGAAVSGFGFVVDLAVLATGIAGLLSSVLVYSITGRPCWSFARTFTRFSTTAIVLGTLLSVALAGATAADAPMLPTVALASLILLGIDLAIGAAVVRVASRRRATWVSASRRLLLGPLRSLRNARIGLDLAAGLALLLLLLLYESTPATSDRAWISALAIAAALFAVASQWIERHLFFVASVFPRMPGRTKP